MTKHRAARHAARWAAFKSKGQMLFALGECVLSEPEKPIPRWVKEAFARALFDVTSANVASWDHVFGRALPKGKHLAAKRRRLKLKEQVWRVCMERRADGAAIGDKLFGAVAEKLKVSLREVRELYYERKNAGWPLVVKGRRRHGAPIIITPKN